MSLQGDLVGGALRGEKIPYVESNRLSGALGEVAVIKSLKDENFGRVSQASESEDAGGVDIIVEPHKKNYLLLLLQVKTDRYAEEIKIKEIMNSEEKLRMSDAIGSSKIGGRLVVPVIVTIPGGVEGEAYNMFSGEPTNHTKETILQGVKKIVEEKSIS